jgi:hypothetical protein
VFLLILEVVKFFWADLEYNLTVNAKKNKIKRKMIDGSLLCEAANITCGHCKCQSMTPLSGVRVK